MIGAIGLRSHATAPPEVVFRPSAAPVSPRRFACRMSTTTARRRPSSEAAPDVHLRPIARLGATSQTCLTLLEHSRASKTARVATKAQRAPTSRERSSPSRRPGSGFRIVPSRRGCVADRRKVVAWSSVAVRLSSAALARALRSGAPADLVDPQLVEEPLRGRHRGLAGGRSAAFLQPFLSGDAARQRRGGRSPFFIAPASRPGPLACAAPPPASWRW
jgi:hypothetical protein